jgi:hypothetical protein
MRRSYRVPIACLVAFLAVLWIGAALSNWHRGQGAAFSHVMNILCGVAAIALASVFARPRPGEASPE